MFARVLVVLSLFSLPAFAEGTAVASPTGVTAPADEAADAADAAEPTAPTPTTLEPPPPPPPPPETLTFASDSTEMITSFVKTMLMLCVVLALVWLTLSKGMGKLVEKAQAGKRVKVVERITLDAKRSLFLVEIDGKHVLIAGGDVVKLADVDDVQKQAERKSVFDKIMSSKKTAADEPPTSTSTSTTTTTTTTEPA